MPTEALKKPAVNLLPNSLPTQKKPKGTNKSTLLTTSRGENCLTPLTYKEGKKLRHWAAMKTGSLLKRNGMKVPYKINRQYKTNSQRSTRCSIKDGRTESRCIRGENPYWRRPMDAPRVVGLRISYCLSSSRRPARLTAHVSGFCSTFPGIGRSANLNSS